MGTFVVNQVLAGRLRGRPQPGGGVRHREERVLRQRALRRHVSLEKFRTTFGVGVSAINNVLSFF